MRNFGKPWTPEDEEELTRLVTEERLTDLECSERMGRSIHGIESKRQYLGLAVNSKPGHARPRHRTYQTRQSAKGEPIHADPATELARMEEACKQHLLDAAQMFGTTLDVVIGEYQRRCEYDIKPLLTVKQAMANDPLFSACSSSAGWME